MKFKFRGIIERKIGDKTIHFKYNMAALTYFGDLQNASLTELGRQLLNPKLSTVGNFMYAGYVTYCRQEKKMQEFTQDECLEWINELGIEEALSMLQDAFDVPDEIKNSQAPEMAGLGPSKTIESTPSADVG